MRLQISQKSRQHALHWKERLYSVVMRKMTDRANPSAPPTERERQFVCTGFILALFSVFAAFFPICGLPIAVTSLVMGLVGRRIMGLYTMATWAVALAVIGLVLALVNIIVSVSIYFSNYIWG
jgi:hypothetical protein